jgi:hypothetical protein
MLACVPVDFIDLAHTPAACSATSVSQVCSGHTMPPLARSTGAVDPPAIPADEEGGNGSDIFRAARRSNGFVLAGLSTSSSNFAVEEHGGGDRTDLSVCRHCSTKPTGGL